MADGLTEEEAQLLAEACIPEGCAQKTDLQLNSTNLVSKTPTNLVSKTTVLKRDRASTQATSANIDGLLSDLGAEMSETELKLILENSVLFGFDQFTLKEEAVLILDKVLEVLRYKEFANQEIRVVGHTCWIGSDEYNLELSKKRSSAVVDWFVKNGIKKPSISSSGLGESQPTQSNETEEGRQANRRVDPMGTVPAPVNVLTVTESA